MSDLDRLKDIAERIGYPGEAALAIILVLSARARTLRDGQKEIPSSHISARQLCDGLLQSETEESWETWRRLRLLTSEDVGRVVQALVEEGLVNAQVGESEADFVGLFDLTPK